MDCCFPHDNSVKNEKCPGKLKDEGGWQNRFLAAVAKEAA
jgi:hypothetical protein